jgi:phosphate transport system substrate-binding protein
MRLPALAAVALALFTSLAGPASAERIRIAGSDLLGEALQRSFESFAADGDRTLAYEMRGSRLGLAALQAGEAELALLVFGAQDPKPGPEVTHVVIGYLTTVVVVPAGLSLSQLHYGQLAGIFGASELNNFRRWSEVGALGEWAPRTISAMALRRSSGLSLDLFRYSVLQTPELKPTVALVETPEIAFQRLRGEEGGIAIMASPPPEDLGLKVLLVSKNPGDTAYPPTPENLHTGDYPLRLPVYLAFRRGEAGRFGYLLRHLLSDEAAPTLQAAGLMPLPVQARNQLVFDLEMK